MADLLKRKYNRETARLHADAELAFERVRSDVAALTAYDIPYSPADPSMWAGTPPTNLGDAQDRLAAGGGTVPVPEL